MIFLSGQSNLEFEPVSHVYKYNGRELISVSSLISQYSTPFDVDGTITARKAAENGLTIEEQKSAWLKIGDESRNKGTQFHADIENYIKTKKIPNTPNKKLVKQFAKFKFKGALYSEVRLFNLFYGIAGTTDLIEVLPNNSINIFDLKTNKAKKMTRFSFGRKMLYPINNIFDSTLDKYEIQLSIYGYMLEEAGWWVNSLTIYHVDYDKQMIKIIPMNNRRKDVIRMLEHYKQNNLTKF